MKSSLKVISIIYIIIGVIGIVVGLIVAIGYSAIFTSDSQTTLARMAFSYGIAMVITSLLGLVIGASGIAGSRGKKSALNVGLILSWVTVIISIVGMVIGLIARQTSAYQVCEGLLQIVLPILFIVFGRGAKKKIIEEKSI